MKNLILSLFIAITSIVNAQHVTLRKDLYAHSFAKDTLPVIHTDFLFTTTSFDEIKKIVDSISLCPKPSYFISESKDGVDGYHFYLKSTSQSNPNFINVYFVYRMVGENKDLEKAGTKTYYFSKIEASRFLDIIDFWKKYFQPNADVEDITNSRVTTIHTDFKSDYFNDDNYRSVELMKMSSRYWAITLK